MTVYDLDKLATPGPLRVLAEYGNRIAGKDEHLMCVCECSSVDEPDTIKREADAKLVAHCRNNFMKALEALKADRQLIACLEFPKSFHLSKAEVLENLDKAIGELVEIKDEI